MHDTAPRLMVVAHGTASPDGSATTRRLIAALAATRPEVPVELCFLDVASPRLPQALAASQAPVVVVPLLLSTGYHVQTDIPAAVADRPATVVARHLGPHRLLVDALIDRLDPGPDAVSTALVGAGSSRDAATAELAATGDALADRLGRPVTVLTMSDDLRRALGGLPPPVRVATYLLAEGQFVSALRTAATGIAWVAQPLGTHPALAELVWTRYDEAREQVR